MVENGHFKEGDLREFGGNGGEREKRRGERRTLSSSELEERMFRRRLA